MRYSIAAFAFLCFGCTPAAPPDMAQPEQDQIALTAVSDTEPTDTEQAEPDITETPAYEVLNSEVRTLPSAILGRSYDLFIRLPPGYHAPENADRVYPVLYLNDGNYCFLTAAGVTIAPMNHGGYAHAILVGLSYAHGETGVASRGRDLTPTRNPAFTAYETGGAREYLTYFRDEIIPFIETEYRADPSHRILSGQSFGGLFGTYALLNEPGLFHDYLLTSPSLWFHNELLFRMEVEFAETHTTLPARVFFATGETETPAINGKQNDMVGQQTRFAEQLRSRNYEGLVVRDEIVPGGTHLTTFPIGLTRGLIWFLPGENPYGG